MIHAALVGNPVERLGPGRPRGAVRLRARPPPPSTSSSPSRSPASRGAWGLACIAAWALTRLTASALRHHRRLVRAVPYLVGTPVCLFLLYLFFESVSYEAVSRALHL